MKHTDNHKRILLMATYEGKESKEFYDKLSVKLQGMLRIGIDINYNMGNANDECVPPDYLAYIAHGNGGLSLAKWVPAPVHYKVCCVGNHATGAINTPSQQAFWDQALKESKGFAPFSGGGKKFRYPVDQYFLYPDIIERIVSHIKAILKESEKRLPLLMHISFNGKLGSPWEPTVWQPKIPDGVHTWEDRKNLKKQIEEQKKQKEAGTWKYDVINEYTETLDPRICFSDNIQGCFSAIYPNIWKLFDCAPKKEKTMIFRMYYPVEFDPKAIQDYKSLTKNRQVWDAYLTHEYCIFSATKMMLHHMELHVDLHNDIGDLSARPYNDPSFEESFHSPKITFEWKNPFRDDDVHY